MNPIRNERGAVVLPFAVITAVVIVIIFMQATERVNQVSKRYAMSQGLTHTQSIAEMLAQRIRYAYDLARAADRPNNAGLCSGGMSRIQIGTSGIYLCLNAAQEICVPHPKSGSPVCVKANVEITARRDMNIENKMFAASAVSRLWSSSRALAAINYAPPEPPAAETSNSLFAPACPTEPGGNCALTCGSADVDCLSFRFCPLTKTLGCSANEFVTQTVAFPKADLNGI
ncbi:MAG TPA: hypothetical protein VM432_08335 [Bdellovibrionales bacterium]|jgi:hypothetical protein|nr:hypothetical protein [Bdellovibrionales bacterium]